MNDFIKFLPYWKHPNKVHYIPYLVYSQLDNDDDNENKEVTNDVTSLNYELVSCWQFDTACLGDVNHLGTDNGNYLEVTTVRVYDSGEDCYNILVTSKILSDFYNGSEVVLWEKDVSEKRIFKILEELKEAQRKLYS